MTRGVLKSDPEISCYGRQILEIGGHFVYKGDVMVSSDLSDMIKKKAIDTLKRVGDYSSVVDVDVKNSDIQISVTFNCGCTTRSGFMDVTNIHEVGRISRCAYETIANHHRSCYKNRHIYQSEFIHSQWFPHPAFPQLSCRIKLPFDCLGLVSLFDLQQIPNWVFMYLKSRQATIELTQTSNLQKIQDLHGLMLDLTYFNKDDGHG